MKKMIAGVIAICLFGGCVPQIIQEHSIVSSATDIKEITDGFITYGVYNDHAAVLKCSDKASGEVVIPGEIENLPVTSIGESAFEGCTDIKTIANEKNIEYIGPYAFKGCISLEGFSNPIPLTSGDQLLGCSALTNLELADTGKTILLTNFTLKNCSNLESVIIPDNYLLNSNFTLSKCPLIKEIKLPAVSSLENVIVSDCDSLAQITLPEIFARESAVVNISQCSNLSVIDLSSSNIANVTIEEMSALERIVFRKEQKINYKTAYCEKLNNVTRSLAYSSELSYETCPTLKDVYYYERTSEKCHIPDVMLLAKNDVTVHIMRSNTPLKKYLEDNVVSYVFIDDEPDKGDANCDGKVNIADAVLVMQVATNTDKYAQGKSEFSISAQGEINADVDGKAGLTNEDALLIQKFKLGLIDKF